MADAKAQNRYRVIERLESGGMAEVFRGEAESLAGFKKAVAIKRVLPHLAQNERFIRMFLDEARLCARLNHANIVQVFDIGHVENTYFIVMEFVDGVNLKAIVEYHRKRNLTVPIPAAIFICMQICAGLQYAHDLTDSDGTPLGIVHRDMSPPNVLISKRGEIKIVDFGLAKAAMQVEKTDPGVVKGKFSYLAPETAMGKEAGPQADIFAVGIMLWEMLSGRRLFMGDSDFQTVKLVQQANVPSLRKINAEVPEALETVISKALARDTNVRYKTAEDLAEDFAQFLSTHQISVTGFDIARIVREVIEEKKANQKREGKREGSIIDKLIQEELLKFTSLGSGEAQEVASTEPAKNEGETPLDPGGFVDLGGLVDDVLGKDFDPTNDRKTSGWTQPGATSSSNLSDQIESSDHSPPQAMPPQDDSGNSDDEPGDEPTAIFIPGKSFQMPPGVKLGGAKTEPEKTSSETENLPTTKFNPDAPPTNNTSSESANTATKPTTSKGLSTAENTDTTQTQKKSPALMIVGVLVALAAVVGVLFAAGVIGK